MFRLILLSPIFALTLCALEEGFIPSVETCGAAITAQPGKGFPDTIHAGIACMQAGLRDVYIGEASELNAIDKNNLQDASISYFIIEGLALPAMSNFDDQVVLFTEEGRAYAAILAQHIEKQFNYLKSNAPVYCLETFGKYSGRCGEGISRLATHLVIMSFYYKKMDFYSWALNGVLLGYRYEDIKYFYEKNNRPDDVVKEYDLALEYIECNKNTALQWLDGKMKKEN